MRVCLNLSDDRPFCSLCCWSNNNNNNYKWYCHTQQKWLEVRFVWYSVKNISWKKNTLYFASHFKSNNNKLNHLRTFKIVFSCFSSQYPKHILGWLNDLRSLRWMADSKDFFACITSRCGTEKSNAKHKSSILSKSNRNFSFHNPMIINLNVEKARKMKNWMT